MDCPLDFSFKIIINLFKNRAKILVKTINFMDETETNVVSIPMKKKFACDWYCLKFEQSGFELQINGKYKSLMAIRKEWFAFQMEESREKRKNTIFIYAIDVGRVKWFFPQTTVRHRFSFEQSSSFCFWL